MTALSQLKTIHAIGQALFEKRSSLDSLWQEIADNFYVERADFTATRAIGQDLASQLDTSYPMLVRRDLCNSFSSMLRPSGQPWFDMTVEDESRLDRDSKAWLEWATQVQRRAMYDVDSRMVRATKEGDNDFGTFGQAVLTVEKHFSKAKGPHLLYRCWHLRDVAWMENEAGEIDTIFHRWKPTARTLSMKFPGKLSAAVTQILEKSPLEQVECRRYVTASENYDGPEAEGFPFVSIYYEVASMQVLECTGCHSNPYVIPRWQTVSGSQYAFSPATVVALPDARLLQAMTSTLLRAGEKFVDPPMLAVQEAIRSDVALYPGGITWTSQEYDERLGEVLRPITQDKSGIPLGQDMQRDIRALLSEAFFINRITLPPPEREMTAYEVGQRVQEYLRYALPLFEPMESDYNGRLCELTAQILLDDGAFGAPDSIPRRLSGANLRFKFQTPLQAAADQKKGAILGQAKALVSLVVDVDPVAASILDARTALRDALSGIQVPAKWTRDEKTVEAAAAQQAKQQQGQQVLDRASQAGELAVDLTKAQQQAGEARALAA